MIKAVKDIKSHKKLLNASEIARRLDITPEYVHMLLSGKRKSKSRLQQIQNLIERELAA